MVTKLVCDKIGVLKKMNRKLKPGLEIKLEPQIRNLRQQAKMLRKGKETRKYFGMKGEKQQNKQNNQYPQGNKSEGTGKRRMTNKVPRHGQRKRRKKNIKKKMK